MNGKLVSWFRINRQILPFDTNKEVIQYLSDELQPFLERSINLVFPLISMDRLIGIVFLHLRQRSLNRYQLAHLRILCRQAGLAFENALLLKERLRQNERMFRAEQLATMGQFAAGIAHELRNPLTAIRSTVQYLASEFEEDSDRKKLAEDVLGEVDRLNHILVDFFTLAKPAEAKPQKLSIRREIEHCLHFVEAQANKRNMQIQLDSEKDLPKLLCDSGELHQVLLNILINSMQAMPDGGLILVKASCSSALDGTVVSHKKKVIIQVEDQGTGIPRDLHEKVFEPFFTTKAGGTGLGLTICRNIVRRYGGEISTEEGANGGTVVKITLPVE
jgi:signal transduction histidine kinase